MLGGEAQNSRIKTGLGKEDGVERKVGEWVSGMLAMSCLRFLFGSSVLCSLYSLNFHFSHDKSR